MRRSVNKVIAPAAFAIGMLAAFQAVAAETVGCPPQGLVAKAKNTLGDYTITWRGVDPSDPSICLSVSVGAGAGINNGKELRRIYAWYDLVNFTMDKANAEKARAALQSALSGTSSEASFDLTMGMTGKNYVWSQTETWKRIGQDMLKIDGRTVTTVKITCETKAGAGTNFSAVWELWYDPATHSFLKGHKTSGGGNVRDFEIVTLSGPS